MKRTQVLLAGIAAMLLLLGSTALMAQGNYPNKPLRVIVPFAPGGGNDILARAVGQRLSDVTGQPVVIDNRAGAGGETGAAATVQSAPDGYTMLLGSVGTFAHNPALKPNLSYDPLRDFAPVSLLATSAFVIVVNPSLPVKNVQELIALAKSQPGKLNFCSAGMGSSTHMTAELFRYAAGVDLTHVPYKGSGPAMVELIAGQTQVMFSTMPPALSHIQSGRLRAIAVTTAKRDPLMPDLPTVAESGLPGFVVENWQGIVLPKQTPPAIVQKLNRDLAAALARPGMADVLNKQGLEGASSTPEAFGALIRDEIDKYRKVVKAANIKIE